MVIDYDQIQSQVDFSNNELAPNSGPSLVKIYDCIQTYLIFCAKNIGYGVK